MRRLRSRAVLAGAVGVTLVAAGIALAPLALAKPIPGPVSDSPDALRPDNLPNPLADKQNALRQEAIEGVLSGKYTMDANGVVDLDNSASSGGNGRDSGGRGDHGRGPSGPSGHGHGGHGRGDAHGSRTHYVQLARETTDRIFVVLAEFGDTQWPGRDTAEYTPYSTPSPYSDPRAVIGTDPAAQRTEGPLHNEIPQPDRSLDNSTVWQADYNQPYFQNLYFGGGESLKKYYENQSSGRYSVDGTVVNWAKVPFTESRYGSNTSPLGDQLAWALVRDAANSWYAGQIAAGRSEADVNAELATFDVWDRYDFDGDGVFDEPDGYIDHFQIVHAGGDEADGDPIYAGDALWSHRWYSYLDGVGLYGPSGNFLGGSRIGNSNLWIGDYTLQPENGGRSVFYHEYGHDLGLPDDYNILSGGDNNNEHWTLMAQSRLGARTDKAIGERGGDLGAWNKAQLGWLNYDLVQYNQHKTIQLGPQEYNSNLPQAIIVNLPPKEVSYELGAPFEGDAQWYSGHQNNSQLTTLSRTVTVPADNPTLDFAARYDIEAGYDYAYVQVNSDYVAAWDGTSGVDLTADEPDFSTYGWEPWTLDLSAYAGQSVTLTFGYQTDPAVGGNDNPDVIPNGLFVDAVTLGGAALDEAGWTGANGFALVGASSTQQFAHYYIAGWRTYDPIPGHINFDQYLKTGPYFFGYANTRPDYVDHYAYQDGLLISYYDTSYDDNDTFAHPGSGRNLYIDSHPQPFKQNSTGAYWRARVQVYDAPFGTQKTDKVTLHVNGVAEHFGGLPAVSTFKDTNTYWYPEVPNQGDKLPGYGVNIRVLNEQGGKIQVKVN